MTELDSRNFESTSYDSVNQVGSTRPADNYHSLSTVSGNDFYNSVGSGDETAVVHSQYSKVPLSSSGGASSHSNTEYMNLSNRIAGKSNGDYEYADISIQG